MRKSFDNTSQCIHVWSNQSQEEGKAGNVRFDKGVLYSYSTPIARIVSHGPLSDVATDAQGPYAVLHTTASYSVTTSRHQSYAKRASTQYRQFHVPNLGVGGGYDYNRNYSGDMHMENMQSYVDRYAAKLKQTYASTTNVEWYMRHCYSLQEEVERYAEFFQVAAYDPALFPALDDTKLVKARARSEKAALKRAEHDRVENAYRVLSMQDKVRAYLSGEADGLPYDWQSAVDNETLRAVNTFSCEQWRSGKSDTCTSPTILLRLKNETTIQTSQRAEFPVSDAIKAFPHIKSCVDYNSAYAYRPGDRALSMGPFKIDSIDADGNVKSGCHFVMWDEIVLMAEKLGLLTTVPATV